MTRSTMRARRDHGGATILLIMVLIVLSALVGAIAVRGAQNELHLAGGQRAARSSFYCAEAGLGRARPIFGANVMLWNTIFAGGAPTLSGSAYPLQFDLDGDGANDVRVTLADNDDEFPTSDRTRDNDLTAVMTAQCTSTTIDAEAMQRQLSQVVTYQGNGGTDYRYQAGHSSTHSGNAN